MNTVFGSIRGIPPLRLNAFGEHQKEIPETAAVFNLKCDISVTAFGAHCQLSIVNYELNSPLWRPIRRVPKKTEDGITWSIRSAHLDGSV